MPENAKFLIIGSFPGQEQTQNEINDEVDWYYGAKKNLFWKIISEVYQVNLQTKEDKQRLFTKYGIGITDILLKVIRAKDSNKDQHLEIIEYNNQIIKSILEKHEIKTILFTSNYVEAIFLKFFPNIKNYSCLLSPSGGANIPISKSEEYLKYRELNPNGNTISFRIYKYKQLLPQ